MALNVGGGATESVAYSAANTAKKDIFKDSPVRFCGFTNEVGAAFENVCKSAKNPLLKSVPALSYVPCLAYLGADIYDKYKKGEDGTGEKPSIKMGAREALFQGATSVVLPTFVVHQTQKFLPKIAKFTAEKCPSGVKNLAKGALNKLPSKLTNFAKNHKGKIGSVALIGASLAALVAATKPIDKIVETVFDKTVDPLLGIKHKETPEA